MSSAVEKLGHMHGNKEEPTRNRITRAHLSNYHPNRYPLFFRQSLLSLLSFFLPAWPLNTRVASTAQLGAHRVLVPTDIKWSLDLHHRTTALEEKCPVQFSAWLTARVERLGRYISFIPDLLPAYLMRVHKVH